MGVSIVSFPFLPDGSAAAKLHYTADLRLNRNRGNEDGNILFGVASAEEVHDYVNEAIDLGNWS